MVSLHATSERLLPASPAPEDLAEHRRHFGPLAARREEPLITAVGRSGLRGRGGAAFPTSVKWQAVIEHRHGTSQAVVVANGCESEPASLKDRTLLSLRPHLVLDGLELTARSVGAGRSVMYLSRAHAALVHTVRRAVAERGVEGTMPIEVVTGPARYVAGEETAIVARLNGRAAKPRAVPPRPYADGVWGGPTLIHNVETLAHIALIARNGPEWFRGAGTTASPGTALVTVTGAVRRPGVIEVAFDETVGGIVERAGGATEAPQAVLLGGYFGRWVRADQVWPVQVDGPSLGRLGLSLGTGVIAVLPSSACGVVETDRVASFLAAQSSGQCGPCRFGLAAIADTLHALTVGRGRQQDLERLSRWARDVRGRGACRHPDGASLFVSSAMDVFATDLQQHLRNRPCRGVRTAFLPTPESDRGWR
jgi:NADH:ubiquinone oxidoreductase subunit F (NADH-binding)